MLTAAAVLRMTAHDDAARAAGGGASGGFGGFGGFGGCGTPGPSSTPMARATPGAVVGMGAVVGAGLGRDASDLALGAHEAALALLQRPSTEGAESFFHLSAPQRLAILAYLVEQATDTEAAGKAILEVHERTLALLDAFEKEDKETRRKQKDNKDDLKSAVRQWLLKEGGATSQGAELGADVDVTDAVVTAEVQRMLDCEQSLFRYPGVPGGSLAPYVGKMSLTLLPLADLRSTEAELCMQLELQASGIDENGRELSAHALAHSNARRDEMRRRRDVLPPARQAALAQLTAALQAPTADALSTALAAARQAALEGDGAVDMVSGAKGGRWMVPEVRDATKALFEIERAAAELENATRRKEAIKQEGCVRTEALGIDRYGRRHWALELDVPTVRPPPPPPLERTASGGPLDRQPSLPVKEEGGAAPAPLPAHIFERALSRAHAAAATAGHGYVVWLQPRTQDVRHVLRTLPPKPGAVVSFGIQDDVSDDDDDDDAAPAAGSGTVSGTGSAVLSGTGSGAPAALGWLRYVGEGACRAVEASLDSRGLRERGLRRELGALHAHLASRHLIAAKEAEREALMQKTRAQAAAAAAAAQAGQHAAQHGAQQAAQQAAQRAQLASSRAPHQGVVQCWAAS